MPQHYELHGLRLCALSDHPAVQQLLRQILQYKGAEATTPLDSADATLDFQVERDPVSRPADARHADLSEQFGLDIWTTPNRMILRRGDTTVDLQPDAGVAKAAIAPDLVDTPIGQRGRSFVCYLGALSLAILLRACGWFPLHAAALARQDRGVLITARSGSGKSTAALSLVHSGWSYLSDDTVLLRPQSDQITAHSFRRYFCVDPDTAARFPELRDTEWPPALSNSSKWQIDLEEVYPGQSADTCTPRLLVLPDLVDAPESRIEPAETKPVLEQLISQGAFFLAPNSDVADRHLAVLRRLIDQSRTYRLLAGRDALDEPRTLHGLLAPLLDGALADEEA